MASSVPHEGDDAGGIVAEINITPLTDVFLVLLIIFMVTSSVIANTGKQVNLPEAAASTATDKQAVNVTITESGEVQVNGRNVPYEQLGAHLKVALDAAEQKTVILRGDRLVILEKAVYVLDQAQLNGAKGFAIATKKSRN
ncbi:MAG: biopolymer transporter ExbD [bacterium]|nr:biopolymer transporter ExbD [bacterium]MCP5068775.1 biopolymer transporter ExbD [bacterium]